jgi:signal transduction histidine kinase
LLSNAIKFSPPHKEVLLTANLEEIVGDFCKQGNHVGATNEQHTYELTVTVRDWGIGISEDAQKHLFQPFQQADTSTTRKFVRICCAQIIFIFRQSVFCRVDLVWGSISVRSWLS